ncbi:MAG TPA: aminoacyl-tRNA hydrolase [Candidatus Paceibacterota bacterium]
MITVIGLGNPGKEYEQTRHNAGRSAAMRFAKYFEFPEFELNKKANALISEGKIKKERVSVILPETFMNKSGSAAGKLFRAKKENKELIVIHDDLDLPLGKIKISYGKNSGGHKGVESVMRALKTKNFVRIRIGICPKRKPGHREQMKFIVGKWRLTEQAIIKKSFKRASQALETIITDSLDRAMSEYNK